MLTIHLDPWTRYTQLFNLVWWTFFLAVVWLILRIVNEKGFSSNSSLVNGEIMGCGFHTQSGITNIPSLSQVHYWTVRCLALLIVNILYIVLYLYDNMKLILRRFLSYNFAAVDMLTTIQHNQKNFADSVLAKAKDICAKHGVCTLKSSLILSKLSSFHFCLNK